MKIKEKIERFIKSKSYLKEELKEAIKQRDIAKVELKSLKDENKNKENLLLKSIAQNFYNKHSIRSFDDLREKFLYKSHLAGLSVEDYLSTVDFKNQKKELIAKNRDMKLKKEEQERQERHELLLALLIKKEGELNA